MAGRETALDVMHARDQVVIPTGGGDRPLYNCEDDTNPVLFEWRWKDNVLGSCEWFRSNPWACKEGARLEAVSPEHVQAGDYADSYVNVNAEDFAGRGPRTACPVACGTCPSRACDAFPCKSNTICRDQVSNPEQFADATDYSCDCGLSGYTGKNCDVDYRECDEEPCRDNNGLSNGICYDSHTNFETGVFDVPEPEGPCVPELYPYPSNHSCYLYVPVGHYKCDCRMDYGVVPEGMELEYNGYKGDKCSACEWTNYQCHSTIVFVISAGLSVMALCLACYKQSGKGSS